MLKFLCETILLRQLFLLTTCRGGDLYRGSSPGDPAHLDFRHGCGPIGGVGPEW